MGQQGIVSEAHAFDQMRYLSSTPSSKGRLDCVSLTQSRNVFNCFHRFRCAGSPKLPVQASKKASITFQACWTISAVHSPAAIRLKPTAVTSYKAREVPVSIRLQLASATTLYTYPFHTVVPYPSPLGICCIKSELSDFLEDAYAR